MKKSLMVRSLLLIVLFSIYGVALELKGVIKVKGSAPHTYLTIEDNATNKSYIIDNAKDYNLTNMQNSTVNLEVKITKDALGPRFPAVVKVLKVK